MSCENIIVFGLFLHDELTGVVQLLKGYPSDKIVFLGLLLVDRGHRKSGLGKRLFEHAEKHIAELNMFEKIRLAVAEENDKIPFWKKLGFQLLISADNTSHV